MRSIVECPLVDMRIPYLLLLHSPAAVITLPPALSRDPPFSPSEPPALSISFIRSFVRSFPPYSFLPSFLPPRAKSDRISNTQLERKKKRENPRYIDEIDEAEKIRETHRNVGCNRPEIVDECRVAHTEQLGFLFRDVTFISLFLGDITYRYI